LDFKAQSRLSGEDDLVLNGAQRISIEALVAAWLEPQTTPETEAVRKDLNNVWHTEKARIGTTREVAVELVVNGLAVDRATLLADGIPRSIKFRAKVARSSWVALRILRSAHTHPVFVRVDRKPIRASRRSVQWCRECVDKVWEVKSPFMRESERPAAADAFDHARKTYETIIAECGVA
jgi:hypothetical protein